MNIALDATYSLGRNLSGVGVYCRRLMWGMSGAQGESRFRFCYRPHRFLRSFGERLPPNASRGLLTAFLRPGGDVFHALNQRAPAARVKRLVVTFHDLFVMTGEYSTAEFRARFTAQAKEAAARADLVIAVSAFTGAQVERLLGVERGRLRVIPHGVAVPAEAPAVSTRRPLVLCVGAIQKRKNMPRLVRAFERLPAEWRLVLAGAGGYDAGETLRTIEASPARERIETPGYVDETRLEQLYAEASVFAFPSLDEGFGIPVLEAMAWGVPVLTSTRSSLPEVAGDAALLVDPEETEEIAEGLLRLAGDAGLREALASRGRERARRYTWQAACERTWAVYCELAG